MPRHDWRGQPLRIAGRSELALSRARRRGDRLRRSATRSRNDLSPGSDFGDFVVWRRDDVPAYQLAVVADDAAMQITEVVRGADLLKSTARQLLLIRALGLPIPAYYHCDLVRDEGGMRLAKRHDALSLRTLRQQGCTPQQVLTMCADPLITFA